MILRINKLTLYCFEVILICLLMFKISPTQSYDGEPRIINGELAKIDNTKHQVSIRIKSIDYPFGNGHICGGSLIGPKKVLTAAHCIYNTDKKKFRNPSEFSVVMGTLNRFKPSGSMTSDVTSLAYLKTFDIKTMTDDVAILFLKKGLAVNGTNSRIQPIPLNNFTLPQGYICQVSGWGKTHSSNKDLPAELRITNVSIVARKDCLVPYGNALRPGMLCAGYMIGGNDACQGDSGGPLVYNGALVGIVSWGSGCGQRQFPGVYADVKYYINWITKTNASGKLSWSIQTMSIWILVLIFNLGRFF